MDKTKIRWADSTWNPMTGCTEVSTGCDRCYAKVIAEKKRGTPAFPVGFDPMVREHKLDLPARRRIPTRYFVNSMSDLFHPFFIEHEAEALATVWATMRAAVQHQFLILTKRPNLMAKWVNEWLAREGLAEVPGHIWLGTSIENDRYAFRANHLRAIRVPIRFISAEPLLTALPSLDLTGVSWVIAGGESGSGYRTMDHAWAADLRDRCIAAGAAFYFKQSSHYRTEQGQLLDGVERWEQYPVWNPDTGEVHPEPPGPTIEEPA